jgi:hypothetical protein
VSKGPATRDTPPLGQGVASRFVGAFFTLTIPPALVPSLYRCFPSVTPS